MKLSEVDSLDSFCKSPSWDASIFRHFALEELTPCYEDILVLGILHLCMIVFGFYHIYQMSKVYTSIARFEETSFKRNLPRRDGLCSRHNFGSLFQITMALFVALTSASNVIGRSWACSPPFTTRKNL